MYIIGVYLAQLIRHVLIDRKSVYDMCHADKRLWNTFPNGYAQWI